MKRIISLLLCIVMVTALCCSCGKKETAAVETETGMAVSKPDGAPGITSAAAETSASTAGSSASADASGETDTPTTVTNSIEAVSGTDSDDGAEVPEAITESVVTESVVDAVYDTSLFVTDKKSLTDGSRDGAAFTGDAAVSGGDGAASVDSVDVVIGDWSDLPWLEEPEEEVIIGEITDPVIEIPVVSDDFSDDISDSEEPAIEPVDPDFDWIIDPEITPIPFIPNITAGMLTAAEWNDNKNYAFLQNLIRNGQQDNYSDYFKAWNLTPFNRIPVMVTEADGVTPIKQTKVALIGTSGETIWTSVTDYEGMAYLFYNLSVTGQVPAKITVEKYALERELEASELLGESTVLLTAQASEAASKALDLMFVVDTTGSMGDEIYYLQAELQDIINRVTGNASDIRLSINFYRDHGDDYIVKSSPFTTDIKSQAALLNTQYANGGGDYEEAVEEALEDAVNAHDWREDSIKLCFMVLDAPPHNTAAIRNQLSSTLTDASAKGVRIIPVASSGVDRSTEFLLRTMSMVTGGTYTFLTDDSGIGGSHLEPIVGDHDVVNLNDLLVKIICDYLK